MKERNGEFKVDIYTLDTIAFLAFLVDELPPEANNIFKKAEDDQVTLIIPSIVIGELIYTILKGKEIFGKKIPIEKINTIFEVIRGSRSILLADMKLNCWFIFLDLDIPELHDRMIFALHLSYQSLAILTNDPEIQKKTNTIW
ncbi:MAG: hypothetical protein ACFFDN_39255 [Candidatus Hodarchaeota archaeon]